MLSRFATLLPDATSREASAILWSIAKLRRPVPLALLDAILAEHHRRGLLNDASPQAVANMLWALATWRHRSPTTLLRFLVARCEALLQDFNPQDTANVLWALAWLDSRPASLLPRLVARAAHQAPYLATQGLANAVWACRRLGHLDRAFLRAAADSFRAKLPAASPTDITLFVSSLAALKFYCPDLLRAVARHCCLQLSSPGPNQRPTQIGADTQGAPGPGSASTLGPRPGYRVAGAGDWTARTGPEGWSARCRLQLLWAVATFEFRDEALVSALVGWAVAGQGGPEGSSQVWEPGGRLPPPEASGGVGGSTGEQGSGPRGRERQRLQGRPPAGLTGGAGAELGTPLGASTFIWCLARLDWGRTCEEQGAALAAAAALWAVRDRAALSHVGVAVWGLERLGLADERLLGLACERLAAALEEAADPADAADTVSADAVSNRDDLGGGGWGGAGGQRSESGHAEARARVAAAEVTASEDCAAAESAPRERRGRGRGSLRPGDLDAAVMVLVCMGRRGIAHDRVLDAFARLGPRLVPRLSLRQLPQVCCAYVRLGRSDAGVLGAAADLLMRGTRQESGQGPQGGAATDAGGGGGDGVLDGRAPAGPLASVASAADGKAAAASELGDLDDVWPGAHEGSDSGTGPVAGRSAPPKVSGGALGRLPLNGLAMTLWALAAGGYASPRLMQRAAAVVMKRFPPDGVPAPAEDPERAAHDGDGEEGDWVSAEDVRGWVRQASGGQPAGLATSPGVEGEVLRGEQLRAPDAMAGSSRQGDAAGAAAAAPAQAGPDAQASADTEPVAGTIALLADAGWSVRPAPPRPELTATGSAGASRTGGATAAAAATPRGSASTASAAAAVTGSGPRWAALILWAFAAADCYNAVLYDTLLAYILGRVERLCPDRVALVLWSCAVSGHYRRDVLEALCGALQGSLDRLPPSSFTQGSWAVAHLTAGLCLSWRGLRPSALAALAPRLSRHQAAVLLWALAVQQLVLTGNDPAGFTGTVCTLMRRLDWREERPAAMYADMGAEAKMGLQPAGVGAAVPQRLVGAEGAPMEEGIPWAAREPSAEDGDEDTALVGGVGQPTAGAEASCEDGLDAGVALIAAEALAMLLLSPHRGVRRAVARHLMAPRPSTDVPAAVRSTAGGRVLPSGPRPAVQDSVSVPNEAPRSAPSPGPTGTAAASDGQSRDRSPVGGGGAAAGGDPVLLPSPLGARLAAAWQLAQHQRHPLQDAVAAAARQLGYAARPLRTHPLLPLAGSHAVELPGAAPGPAVVLLADAADFASNVSGQPLGPLFVTVQLLKECGWRVAVVVAQQFGPLRTGPRWRAAAHLRGLLAAAGVTGSFEAGPGALGDRAELDPVSASPASVQPRRRRSGRPGRQAPGAPGHGHSDPQS